MPYGVLKHPVRLLVEDSPLCASWLPIQLLGEVRGKGDRVKLRSSGC